MFFFHFDLKLSLNLREILCHKLIVIIKEFIFQLFSIMTFVTIIIVFLLLKNSVFDLLGLATTIVLKALCNV